MRPRVSLRNLAFHTLVVAALAWLLPVLTPSSAFAGTAYSTSFETGLPSGWTVGSFPGYNTTRWGAETWTARTGTGSLWCAQDGNWHAFDHTYNDSMSTYARLTLDLSAYEDASLTFWYRISSADAPIPVDAGFVHIYQSGAYIGEARFIPTGADDLTWHQAAISLNRVAGKSDVVLEWVWISDSSSHGAEGWVVDDVLVNASNVKGPTSPIAGDVPGDAGGRVDLAWQASATGGTDYRIYRSDTSGGPYAPVGTTSALTYRDTGLTNKQTYYYVVTAFTGPDDQSPYSAEVSAIPLDNQAPSTMSRVRGTLGENSRTGPTDWYVGDATAEVSTGEAGSMSWWWGAGAHHSINPASSGVWYANPGAVPEGISTLSYYGTDLSGNADAVPNSDVYMRDSRNPSAPTGIAVLRLDDAVVKATWNDDGADLSPGSGRDHYDVLMATGTVAGGYDWVIDVTGTSYETQGVEGMTYWFTVKTEDVAGNRSVASSDASATAQVTVVIPSISVGANVARVVYGGNARFSGNLTDAAGGLAGQTVRLERKSYGSSAYTPVRVGPTGPAGYWSLTDNPAGNAWYRVRFAGAGKWEPAVSAPVYVEVGPKVGIYSSSYSTRRYRRVKIHGSVSPRHPYKYVYIQMKQSGGWRTLARVRLDASARYAWYFTPKSRRTYVLRAHFPTVGDHVTADSRQISVRAW